jgi:hypothetical protein
MRVLIVEDEKDMAQVLEVGLAEENHLAGRAFDGVVGWKWRGRAASTRRGGSHLRVSNERPRSLSVPHLSSDRIGWAHR